MAEGILTNKNYNSLINKIFNGLQEVKIAFPDGNQIVGKFLISKLELDGLYNHDHKIYIEMHSSGMVEFIS